MAKHRKPIARRKAPATEVRGRPRVIVVDDYAPILEHVAELLEQEFTVAGLLLDAESLIERWAAARPDVIVLDISLLGCSGFDALARLRQVGCDVPIVFLSVHEAPEIVRASWAAGGLAYVAKRDIGWDLIPAIQAALAGRRYVSTTIEA
jgi:DNA-binding NarL/FixJ family response regulator